MSTYLKLDAELPAGLNYLNINSISLPSALANVGNITNAFAFKGGLNDLVGSAAVVGIPIAVEDGYMLGYTGYIDTGLKETAEFLWVALVKVSSSGVFTPIISNFVEKAQSTSGFSKGCNLAKQTTALKFNDASDSVSTFTTNNLTVGNWQLVALSKKSESSGFKYHFASKPAGQVMQTGTSNSGSSAANDENNICIGWTPKAASSIPNGSTMFRFASVYDKGLTAAELNALMNSLISELALSGVVL